MAPLSPDASTDLPREVQAVLDAAVDALPRQGTHGAPSRLENATVAYLAWKQQQP